MGSNPLVSIVVPVYNIEKYLNECVNSLIYQSYDNTEILLIDDGSTDSSGVLCEVYSKQFANVTAIHKKNGGLSSARNTGTKAAKGEYIAFVDGDDYVSPIFIESLVNAAMWCDCKIAAVPGGAVFSDDDLPNLISGSFESIESLLTVMDEKVFQEELLYQRIANGAQFRLYSANLAKEILFPEGILYEDMATVYKMVHNAGSVAYIDTNRLYAYRVNPDGITRGAYKSNKADSVLTVVQEMRADIECWFPDLKNAVSSRSFSSIRAVYAQAMTADSPDAERLWNDLLPLRKNVAFDVRARKRERLAATIALFGRPLFNLFCNVCRRVGLMI